MIYYLKIDDFVFRYIINENFMLCSTPLLLVDKENIRERTVMLDIDWAEVSCRLYGKHSCFESAAFSKKILTHLFFSLFSSTQTTIDLNIKCYEWCSFWCLWGLLCCLISQILYSIQLLWGLLRSLHDKWGVEILRICYKLGGINKRSKQTLFWTALIVSKPSTDIICWQS